MNITLADTFYTITYSLILQIINFTKLHEHILNLIYACVKVLDNDHEIIVLYT